MTRRASVILSGVSIAVVLASALPALAVPVFARKYGFNCTMCHSSFPRLNDYGERYRRNGYQLPGRESEERTVFESPAPIAFRTSAGYNSEKLTNSDSQGVSEFQLASLDILSAGLFAPRIGYLMVFPPHLEASRGVVGQSGTLEMASVVFSGLGAGLSARVGRFEPAYVAFSDKRKLSVSGYPIYDIAFPTGPAFSDTQDGIELRLHPNRSMDLYAGWVNGSSDDNGDPPTGFYLRAANVFGEGEGQTAGQRLGVSVLRGRSRPPSAGDGDRRSFTRWGPDASINLGQLHVDAQYLRGTADSDLAPSGGGTCFSGGFVQLLYMPRTDFAWFARADRVNLPDGAGVGDLTGWTVGGRYYPADNLALHLEYSRLKEDSTVSGAGDPVDRLLTVRLDFAF